MANAIVIKLELGHIAKIRDVPLPSGHTHDWMVFVKGADGMNIEHFVDKVVFWLHESYDPPKFVARYPPYQVRQTGYAGFNLLIDIHFKITSDPKYVRFHYDLFLNNENMPPVNHTRVEMLTFNNPVEEFKRRLIKAGGEMKVVDVKEKKSSKKSHRKEVDKQSRPSKEKNDRDKPKPHRADARPPKHEGRSEERRRSSVGDGEAIKRKKNEEKLVASSNPTSGVDSKAGGGKVNKLKIKMDDSVAASLFSREESIDIKRIKKKDAPSSRKDEQRKGKEKRPESKLIIKQEKPDVTKHEKSDRKKKERKSPDVPKQKTVEEAKPKRRPRRVSFSSDSDSDVPPKKQPAILSDSDSDVEQARKKRKHDRVDRIKSKKSIKKEKRSKKTESVPARGHNPTVTDMDICHTPPSDHSTYPTKGKYQEPAEAFSKDKKSKTKTSNDKTRVTPAGIKIHIKDVKVENVPAKSEKERPLYRSSKGRGSSAERKIANPSSQQQQQLPGRKDMKPVDSSESSDESGEDVDEEHPPERHLFKNSVSPSSTSSSSSSSSSVREIPQFNHGRDEDVADLNCDLPLSPGHLADGSDSESKVLESPDRSEGQLDTSAESNNKQMTQSEQDEVMGHEIQPVVQVGTGTTLNIYPELTDEIFEELRQLQLVLASVTSRDVIKEIESIIRKFGNYDVDDDGIMNFDLCSLNRKAIRKLRKHLRARSK